MDNLDVFDQTQAVVLDDFDEDDLTDELESNEEKKPAAFIKVLFQKGLSETTYPLYEGDNIIGRHVDTCHVCIPSKSLSKEHACVQIVSGSHLISDKSSRNKTRRGKLLLRPEAWYELKHGDEIAFADVKCIYEMSKQISETVAETDSENDTSESLMLHHDVTDEHSFDVTNNQADVHIRKDYSVERVNISVQETQVFSESDNEERKNKNDVQETVLLEDSDPETSGDQFMFAAATQAYTVKSDSKNVDDDDDSIEAATQAYTSTWENVQEEDALSSEPTQAFLQPLKEKKGSPNSIHKPLSPQAGTLSFVTKVKNIEGGTHSYEKTITKNSTQNDSGETNTHPTQVFDEDEDEGSQDATGLFAVSTVAFDGGDKSDGYEGDNSASTDANGHTQVMDLEARIHKSAGRPYENINLRKVSNNCDDTASLTEPVKNVLMEITLTTKATTLSSDLPTQKLDESLAQAADQSSPVETSANLSGYSQCYPESSENMPTQVFNETISDIVKVNSKKVDLYNKSQGQVSQPEKDINNATVESSDATLRVVSYLSVRGRSKGTSNLDCNQPVQTLGASDGPKQIFIDTKECELVQDMNKSKKLSQNNSEEQGLSNYDSKLGENICIIKICSDELTQVYGLAEDDTKTLSVEDNDAITLGAVSGDGAAALEEQINGTEDLDATQLFLDSEIVENSVCVVGDGSTQSCGETDTSKTFNSIEESHGAVLDVVAEKASDPAAVCYKAHLHSDDDSDLEDESLLKSMQEPFDDPTHFEHDNTTKSVNIEAELDKPKELSQAEKLGSNHCINEETDVIMDAEEVVPDSMADDTDERSPMIPLPFRSPHKPAYLDRIRPTSPVHKQLEPQREKDLQQPTENDLQQSTENYLQQPTEKDDLQQPTENDDLQQPTEKDDLQQPTENDDLQQPTENDDLQQPTEKDDLQQPTEKDDLQQPTEKDDLQQPTENYDLQQPTENDDLQQPTENYDLQQPIGKDDLQKPIGKDDLQKPIGKDDLQQPIGKDDLQQSTGKDDQQPTGKDDLQQPTGKDDLQQPTENHLQQPTENDLQQPTENDLQQPTENDDLQQSAENDDLQQPTEKDDLQQPTGKDDLQQPTGKDDLQQPTGKDDLQQPTGKDDFQQPTENDDLQQPTEKDDLQQPTETNYKDTPVKSRKSSRRPASQLFEEPKKLDSSSSRLRKASNKKVISQASHSSNNNNESLVVEIFAEDKSETRPVMESMEELNVSDIVKNDDDFSFNKHERKQKPVFDKQNKSSEISRTSRRIRTSSSIKENETIVTNKKMACLVHEAPVQKTRTRGRKNVSSATLESVSFKSENEKDDISQSVTKNIRRSVKLEKHVLDLADTVNNTGLKNLIPDFQDISNSADNNSAAAQSEVEKEATDNEVEEAASASSSILDDNKVDVERKEEKVNEKRKGRRKTIEKIKKEDILKSEINVDDSVHPRVSSRGRRISTNPYLKDFETERKTDKQRSSLLSDGEEKVTETKMTNREMICGKTDLGKRKVQSDAEKSTAEESDSSVVQLPHPKIGRSKKIMKNDTSTDDIRHAEIKKASKSAATGQDISINIDFKPEEMTRVKPVRATRTGRKCVQSVEMGNLSHLGSHQIYIGDKDQSSEPPIKTRKSIKNYESNSSPSNKKNHVEESSFSNIHKTQRRQRRNPPELEMSTETISQPKNQNIKLSELQIPFTPAAESQPLAAAEQSKARGRGRKSMSVESVTSVSTESKMSSARQSREKRNTYESKTTKRGDSHIQVPASPAKKSKLMSSPQTPVGKTEVCNISAQSPTLRKSSTGHKPRVMFTGLIDEQGEKIVKDLGGEMASTIQECTHLVTDKIRRTVKFLSGLAKGLLIVSPRWLESCKQAGTFIDGRKFLVSDPAMEKQYKFNLASSLSRAQRNLMLTGYRVHVSKSVKPDPSQMQDVLTCAGANYLTTMPGKPHDNTIVVSCKEDHKLCQPAIKAGIPIVEVEFILTGILRQDLDFKSFVLPLEDLSQPSGKGKASR